MMRGMNGSAVDVQSRQNPRDEKYPDPDGMLMECPRFANQGCFKAEFYQSPDDLELESFGPSFHKGCSLYPLGDLDLECRRIGTDTVGYLGTSCKGNTIIAHGVYSC